MGTKTNGHAVATSDIKPRNGKYPCPECSYKAISAATLGNHRRKHGIQGTSHGAITSAALRREENKANGHVHPVTQQQEEQEREIQRHVIFLAGSTFKEIQIYADSHGLPGALLAEGVAAFLQFPARGRKLGAINRLPAL